MQRPSSENESLINIQISAFPFTGVWTQLKISTGILAQVPSDKIWLFWALTPILIYIPRRRELGQMDLGLNLDPWHKRVIKFCLEFFSYVTQSAVSIGLFLLQVYYFPQIQCHFFKEGGDWTWHKFWLHLLVGCSWPSHVCSLSITFLSCETGITITFLK